MAKLVIDDYTKRKTQAELEKHIKNLEKELTAWESVKRIHKKDGKNFETLSKNFENGKVWNEYGSDKFSPTDSFVDYNGKKNTYPLRDYTLYVDITGDNETDIKNILEKIEEVKIRVKIGIDGAKADLERLDLDFTRANNMLARIEKELDSTINDPQQTMGNAVYWEVREVLKNYTR